VAPATPRRHRVVLAHPMPLDTARLQTLGVAVAMPLPATWTGVAVDQEAGATAAATEPTAETTTAALAPAADPAVLPFSFPLPEGVQLVMGSDIVADPRLGLQALVGGAAAPPDGEADTAPADRTLVAGALATLTSGAAQTLGAQGEWGKIEPGRLADLVVLSADLFDLPSSHLLDAVVIATIVDGKVVYDRDTDTPPPTP
jgi:predicted amidohydrolase YtcJ